MRCPVCKETNLVMTDRQGIEIDYCPQCRGVWLDRGELDKIIERAAPATPQPPPPMPPGREAPPYIPQAQGYPPRRDRDDDDDDDRYDYRKRKKRGGFLGELFEFD